MPALATLHEKQNGRCYYCERLMLPLDNGEPFHPLRVTRDHRVPKSKGGKGGPNIVGACYECNHRKGDRFEHEFRVDAGWLAQNPVWLRREVADIRSRARRSEKAVEKWTALQQPASPPKLKLVPAAPSWHFKTFAEPDMSDLNGATIRWATMARCEIRNKLYLKLCAARGEEPDDHELRL